MPLLPYAIVEAQLANHILPYKYSRQVGKNIFLPIKALLHRPEGY